MSCRWHFGVLSRLASAVFSPAPCSHSSPSATSCVDGHRRQPPRLMSYGPCAESCRAIGSPASANAPVAPVHPGLHLLQGFVLQDHPLCMPWSPRLRGREVVRRPPSSLCSQIRPGATALAIQSYRYLLLCNALGAKPAQGVFVQVAGEQWGRVDADAFMHTAPASYREIDRPWCGGIRPLQYDALAATAAVTFRCIFVFFARHTYRREAVHIASPSSLPLLY